jgi:hypothetical protein
MRPEQYFVSTGDQDESFMKLTAPICLSIVAIRLLAFGLRSLLVTSFSIARTTPSLHLIPIDVPPFSTAFTAYSTWKFRPSGEKTEF